MCSVPESRQIEAMRGDRGGLAGRHLTILHTPGNISSHAASGTDARGRDCPGRRRRRICAVDEFAQ